MPDNSTSFQRNPDGTRQVSAVRFLIESLLSTVSTATLVKVVGVSNTGTVTAPGTVDILPLVNLLDGAGNATRHAVIYGCPYVRLQGGANAVILDPQVGDLGLAVFADRDISSVVANKASKTQANPGSARRFDMADAIYVCGLLNGVPTQYVQVSASGIKIHSPTAVILDAPDVQINCATLEIAATTSATITTPTLTINGTTQANGAINATGTVTAPTVVGTTDVSFGGKSGIAHQHDHGTMTGTGHTGAPI